jgi:hypothetical protein
MAVRVVPGTRGGAIIGVIHPPKRRIRHAHAGPFGTRPIPRNNGLLVVLRELPGWTPPGLLDDPFTFQCPPLDSFSRQLAYTWADYSTLHAGKFSRPESVDLKVIPLTTAFVDFDAPWTMIDFDPRVNDPLAMVARLEAIMASGKPFKFQAGMPHYWAKPGGGPRWEVQMNATLRSITPSEKAGENDARYVDLSFTEFRSPFLVSQARGVPKGQSTDRELAKIDLNAYVRSGRAVSLYDLAKNYYGAVSGYRLIVAANPWLRSFPPSRDLRDYKALKAHHVVRIPARNHSGN